MGLAEIHKLNFLEDKMPVSEELLRDHEKLKNEVEELADQVVYASEDLMGIEIALEEAKEELEAFEKEHREEL